MYQTQAKWGWAGHVAQMSGNRWRNNTQWGSRVAKQKTSNSACKLNIDELGT